MLQRVTIQNFHSCQSTKLELGSRIAALVGRNGVGKTTILEALDWVAKSVRSSDPMTADRVRGGHQNLQTTTVELEIQRDHRTYQYALTVPFLIHDRHAGDHRDKLLVHSEQGAPEKLFERTNEEIRIEGRRDPVRTGRLTPSLSALRSILPADDALQDHLSFLLTYFSGVSYYSLEDESADDSFHIGEQAYSKWRMRYEQEADPGASVALRLIHLWKEDRDTFEALKVLLGPEELGLLQDLAITEHGGFVTGLTDERAYLVLFKPGEGMGGTDRPLLFSQLSAGTRRVIRMMTSLLFDQRSLMLIEHPEDSIHFKLLRKLIEDEFRSYAVSSQVIFTTHSSQVLDILRPEEVLLTTAENGNTVVRRLSEAEIEEAKWFLDDRGTLSEYLGTLNDLTSHDRCAR